jgi:thiamine pyrophosphate-dependent acetolactate synthase large subunit-like protein
MSTQGQSNAAMLERESVTHRLVKGQKDPMIVCGLGTPVSNVATAGDRDLNFYMTGGMGAASAIGLGLAIAQPDRLSLVVTGDGEMMMGIGLLTTIAIQAPRNLSIVVFDNEMYGETGMQKSQTAYGIDLAAIATASGMRNVMTVLGEDEVDALVERAGQMEGPFFGLVKVKGGRYPNVIPVKGGVELKIRFRRALLGTY